MEEKRTCQECGTEIWGRVDKKFCSDQCRNTYNNKVNKLSNAFVRKVNYNLRKNRHLMELVLKGKEKGLTKVRISDFLRKGFSFDYFTHTYQNKKGETYYFCYEYGYLRIDTDYLLIVVRKEYLK